MTERSPAGAASEEVVSTSDGLRARWSDEAIQEAKNVGHEYGEAVIGAAEQIGRTRDPSGRVSAHMVREAAVFLGNPRSTRTQAFSTLGGATVGIGGSGLIAVATIDQPDAWFAVGSALVFALGTYLLGLSLKAK